jgi:epoxyqueuosine reductase
MEPITVKALHSEAPVAPDPAALARRIKALAREAGFQRCGISDIVLDEDESHLRDWLAQGLYGSMQWMARHGDKRSRPGELLPGTVRVVSVGLDYGRDVDEAWATLAEGERAYVARYALGRDYHKLMRQRLQALADRIAAEVGPFGHRVFVDSAPVLERALARNAGLGWIGKHTCLIDKDGGSWFFLGEIYVDLPLPVDQPASAHCGTCTRCIDVCPTQAITAPYRLDARRCIS